MLMLSRLELPRCHHQTPPRLETTRSLSPTTSYRPIRQSRSFIIRLRTYDVPHKQKPALTCMEPNWYELWGIVCVPIQQRETPLLYTTKRSPPPHYITDTTIAP